MSVTRAEKIFASNSFILSFTSDKLELRLRFLDNDDYLGKSLTHLSLNKEFIGELLVELNDRADIDTIIDVHTHPFSSSCLRNTDPRGTGLCTFLRRCRNHGSGKFLAHCRVNFSFGSLGKIRLRLSGRPEQC